MPFWPWWIVPTGLQRQPRSDLLWKKKKKRGAYKISGSVYKVFTIKCSKLKKKKKWSYGSHFKFALTHKFSSQADSKRSGGRNVNALMMSNLLIYCFPNLPLGYVFILETSGRPFTKTVPFRILHATWPCSDTRASKWPLNPANHAHKSARSAAEFSRLWRVSWLRTFCTATEWITFPLALRPRSTRKICGIFERKKNRWVTWCTISVKNIFTVLFLYFS